jgi:hypothetical protein
LKITSLYVRPFPGVSLFLDLFYSAFFGSLVPVLTLIHRNLGSPPAALTIKGPVAPEVAVVISFAKPHFLLFDAPRDPGRPSCTPCLNPEFCSAQKKRAHEKIIRQFFRRIKYLYQICSAKDSLK